MFLNQPTLPPYLKGWSVIFFGGDVNLGRRNNYNIHEKPFGNLPIMEEADLRIINLECVVAAQGTQGIDKGEGGPFYYHARPEQTNLLAEAHIDVALTANNHSLDYYEAALLEQNQYLDRAGILHLGTGKNVHEASRPLFIKVNEIIVALFNVDATMRPFAATEDKAGSFYLPPDKPELWREFFASEIADARRKADVVLVAPHWGPNGVEEPLEQTKILGRLLIDCGADAVLGCHSHFLHGVENYKQRPIIYDAGNFLFDANAGLGGAFSIVISKRGVEQVFFVPLVIDYCKISPTNNEQAVKLCSKFLEACRKLNAEGTARRNDLVEFKFEPPRSERTLESVELSIFGRRGEKIPPMTEPLPEWTPKQVPDDARIEPQGLGGGLYIVGCRVPPECLVIERRKMLYVETYWMLDAPTNKNLKFRILGVPTVKNAMPNFGAGMEHQGCDWMFPTNRWKPGVIYYERFGLRLPYMRELVNVDVALQISVLDDKTELGKYIHATRIQMQIPNRPTLTPAPESSPVTPAQVQSPPVTPAQVQLPLPMPVDLSVVGDGVDMEEFKREFKAKNGVVFFTLRNLKANASGLELSALRRGTLFRNYLGCEVLLLTNEYQNDLFENFERYKSAGKMLNMYDYFQEIDRTRVKPRRFFLESLMQVGWRIERLERDWRIRRQDGTTAMYCAFTLKDQKLGYINFFDENRKKIRRDTFDSLGFLSRRQFLDVESGEPIEELYYKPDGSVAIRSLYEIVDKKAQIRSIELVGKDIKVDHPRKLIRYWLEQLTADQSRAYFFIGDRSPEYTRFYVEVKRRGLKNIFVLHQLHNIHVLAPFEPMTSQTKRWFNFLTDLSLQSDAVITLTTRQRADIIRRYNLNNVIVLPHSLSAVPRVTDVELDPFKIIQVGRIVEEKGHAKAIEAMKIVLKKVPQATLHFYGRGSLQGKLQELIDANNLGEHVKFEGFSENMPAEFASSAMSILPSTFEGFSMVVQESLQQSCPVVAFDCNYGPADMIEDGVNGYLVPVDDIEALADRIIKVLSEPGLRQKFSENSLKSVEKFYPEVVASQWAELFCKLMKKKGE